MDDLHEIEAIKRLKYRYMRCLDQKRWDEIRDCFVEDATAAYSGGKYAFTGRDAIVDFFAQAMGSPGFLSSHRVHHPEIDLTAADRATGIWALEDVVVDVDRAITLRGAAFYTDAYVKVGGVWKIEHTGYERTFEEVEPRPKELVLTQRASFPAAAR